MIGGRGSPTGCWGKPFGSVASLGVAQLRETVKKYKTAKALLEEGA